tara:strand:+ start:3820 stop:3993 length:174 start_codon:yes stop_codon:yes gene_type:complete
MKFYEVKQRMCNGLWNSCGFFRKKKDAEKCCSHFNTKIEVYPTKIIEHEFLKPKDFE